MTIEIIAIVIAVLIAAILIYAATRPDTFRIQRATTINAPPDKIFPLIDDLHAQRTWSPFEKDPAMKATHSGAPRGKGAAYEWSGNRHVGAGRVAITDTVPNSKVAMTLDMSRPFQCHNTVEFTVEPQGDAAVVTWAMQGPQPYMAKLMGVFIDCDKMCGGEFEKGLAKLKSLAEK